MKRKFVDIVGDDICDVVHVMVDELTAFERLKKTYNVVMNQMLTKYRHIFDDEITGMTDHEHHIFLWNDVKKRYGYWYSYVLVKSPRTGQGWSGATPYYLSSQPTQELWAVQYWFEPTSFIARGHYLPYMKPR
jgi:hypothetical protein